MRVILSFILLSFVGVCLTGCPFPMDSGEEELYLSNTGNQKIYVLMNLVYPDSSLHHAMPDRYIDAHSGGYIGSFLPLKRQAGVTVILFEYLYFTSQANNADGRPDTYLDESRILQRYVYSRTQLDSLKWQLSYP